MDRDPLSESGVPGRRDTVTEKLHTAYKRQALAEHSRQAAQFATRYSRLAGHPYETCFAYSRHRLDAVLGRLLPERGEGLRMLDIGCGTGHYLARFGRQGFKVAGLDGSDEMIAHAKAQNPGVRIERGDVEAIPFPSAQFDVLLCIEVLRYLPRFSACLREMARVLRPGGMCVATATPLLNLNGYWLVNRLASTVGVPGFVRLKQFFSTSWRLRREFLAAGFERPEVHGVYFGPVNWVERLAPRLAPAFLRRWEPVDSAVADRPVFREFANLFLVRAVRGPARG
jgi:2-polyprenyl-3-methyl-5-hydroxy-6-metoxy-1,4-benzoquinol methylase